MYKSPINMCVERIAQEINGCVEGRIYEAIAKADIYVNRDELIKALTYDRDQYEKGYEDGKAGAQKWISVEERLPEGEVLAANFAPGTYGYKEYIIGYVSAARCTEPGGCFAENDHEILHDVTHWMPLPEPPKEETPCQK